MTTRLDDVDIILAEELIDTKTETKQQVMAPVPVPPAPYPAHYGNMPNTFNQPQSYMPIPQPVYVPVPMVVPQPAPRVEIQPVVVVHETIKYIERDAANPAEKYMSELENTVPEIMGLPLSEIPEYTKDGAEGILTYIKLYLETLADDLIKYRLMRLLECLKFDNNITLLNVQLMQFVNQVLQSHEAFYLKDVRDLVRMALNKLLNRPDETLSPNEIIPPRLPEEMLPEEIVIILKNLDVLNQQGALDYPTVKDALLVIADILQIGDTHIESFMHEGLSFIHDNQNSPVTPLVTQLSRWLNFYISQLPPF
ncbi:hypothetical protein [Endozoicomonas sp. ONNA1]|uniref:hypothetical protein n=1 Tax=Endozoicomonas sp. ONNA1 TaxID=2828740 RepID=UPI002148E8B7|nr:hypothetical protein [Endozoicomonas sp. ONNA1]